MTVFDSYKEILDFSRSRVHAMLDDIEQMDEPTSSILSWRPGEGRAHIGWQIMHVAVTEEMFGTQRLADRASDALHANIWDDFKGGSTPADKSPEVDHIRAVLNDGRQAMLQTLHSFSESDLDTFSWTHPRLDVEISLRRTLQIIAYHESHHHGQAHITLNLYKNRLQA